MLAGLTVFLAVWFVRYAAYVLFFFCTVCIGSAIAIRCSCEDRQSFIRFFKEGICRAFTTRRRIFWASVLVVASAIGSVWGIWSGLLVTAAAAHAVWVTCRSIRGLIPGRSGRNSNGVGYLSPASALHRSEDAADTPL